MQLELGDDSSFLLMNRIMSTNAGLKRALFLKAGELIDQWKAFLDAAEPCEYNDWVYVCLHPTLLNKEAMLPRKSHWIVFWDWFDLLTSSIPSYQIWSYQIDLDSSCLDLWVGSLWSFGSWIVPIDLAESRSCLHLESEAKGPYHQIELLREQHEKEQVWLNQPSCVSLNTLLGRFQDWHWNWEMRIADSLSQNWNQCGSSPFLEDVIPNVRTSQPMSLTTRRVSFCTSDPSWRLTWIDKPNP